MKNKNEKKQLLKNGTFNDFRKNQYELFKQLEDYDEVKNVLKFMYKEDYINLKQLLEARKKQIKKIKKWIEWHILKNYKLYFFTFTYDDKKRRKEMKAETLKKYVINSLQDVDDFIINIDYGKQNERLHFHGIIAINENTNNLYKIYENENKKLESDNKNYQEYIKKVGFCNIQKIGNQEADKDKIARYITKLTLHSIKVKQKYISTKKGTEYQKTKKAIEKFEKIKKVKGNEKISLEGMPFYIKNAFPNP